MARKNWCVYVAELERTAQGEDLEKGNPRWSPERPIVLVGYVANLPRQKFPDDDFSSAGAPILKSHGKRLLPLLEGANPYTEEHKREWGALSSVVDWVEQLRSDGYMVYNRPLRNTRLLYVLELGSAILDRKKPKLEFTVPGFRDNDLPSVWSVRPERAERDV